MGKVRGGALGCIMVWWLTISVQDAAKARGCLGLGSSSPSTGRGLRLPTSAVKENRRRGATWRAGVHDGVVADHLGSGRCRSL